MTIIETHIVPEGVAGTRFSDYACEITRSLPSRKAVKKAIKRGEFLIDGRKAETGDRVRPGQKIELIDPDVKKPKPYRLSLNIVYEDDHLAVIDKPAGVPVNGNRFKTVENALPYNLAPSAEADAMKRPRPVHRLDASTGGLLLCAKTAHAMMELGRQFEGRSIRKRYRAVVIGRLPESGRIVQPLEGREAVTEFSALRYVPSLRNGWLTLADLVPHTGRMHQLRKHLADYGFPIMGDSIYGSPGQVLRSKGLFLCAVELSFTHPTDGRPVTVQIDEPEKFGALLDREQRRFEKYNPPA